MSAVAAAVTAAVAVATPATVGTGVGGCMLLLRQLLWWWLPSLLR